MVDEGIKKEKKLDADIVIIGSGGAGLAAAVAAAERGASVIVLEKRSGLGGNSARAFGIFAAESPVQKRAHIDCSRDRCFKIAMDWAHWKINAAIIRAFIDKSGDTIRWLEEKGLEFACNFHNPDQEPVFHLIKGRGAALIKVLTQKCRDMGVQLLTRSPAKKILTGSEGDIIGVLAESDGGEFTIASRSVIISSGGYGGNKVLLRKYCPDYRDDMERIGFPHTGDGLTMAIQAGAATEGLGILLLGMPSALHPPDLKVKPGTKPGISQIGLISIAADPRTLWVNKTGQRFVDENLNNIHFLNSNAIIRQPDNLCYTLWDSKITQTIAKKGPSQSMGLPKEEEGDMLPGLEKDLRTQADKKDFVKIFNSRDEISAWMGADPKVLKASIDKYNAACDQGYDPIFSKDREYLMPLRTPPYYGIRWHASFINTIGGININEHTEVLDKNGDPIPGLYAAGVDTGGWESATYCMRLPGHAFGFSVYSGRIAGENASVFIKGLPGNGLKSGNKRKN